LRQEISNYSNNFDGYNTPTNEGKHSKESILGE
jgi:hypothetical protein